MSKEVSKIVKNEQLPAVRSADASFYNYVREIQKFPLLTFEEEQKYAEQFQKTADKEAAKMLVQSHLRLVVKIASKFRSYGLPIVDLVSEGILSKSEAMMRISPEDLNQLLHPRLDPKANKKVTR